MAKQKSVKSFLSILLSALFLFSLFAGLKATPLVRAETAGQQQAINWDNVNAAIELIHNIGDVGFTYESLAEINAARTAYDALNDREKIEISNYGDLTDAEAAFRNLSQGHNTAVRLIVDGAVDGILDTHATRVYFGKYSQSINADPTAVLWRVLEHSGGKMLLLSDRILAYKPYHISSAVNVLWTSCSLRTWLNGSGTASVGGTNDIFFDNAFTAAEQTAVLDTDVNEIIPSGGAGQTGSGNENTDKVFILSSAEVMNTPFGFPDSPAATDTRAASHTPVSITQAGTGFKNGTWWLRDTDAGTSRWVDKDGQVLASSDTGSYNQSDLRGVRPALFIDLSRVLFASPASGGKDADGAFAKIPVYTGSEWKLTVRNNSYRFSVEETEATAERGETVMLNYTKAKYGANDRISAILVNAQGNPVYYGQIAQPTAADGSVDITIPQDIMPGNYTLRVFNEQLNGDYATDYASAFCDVALSIPCRHDWRQTKVTGSCEESITRYYTCRICGETKTETEAGSGEHDWQESHREGDDEEGWTIWYYCKVCDVEKVENVEGLFRETNWVIAAINAIGQVEYTAECKARIDYARTWYNYLPDRLLKYITNYSVLTEAEETYAALAQAAENTTQPEETTQAEETTTGASDHGGQQGGDLCKWCGELHEGFWGKIVGFFHSILYFFAHLFGRK